MARQWSSSNSWIEAPGDELAALIKLPRLTRAARRMKYLIAALIISFVAEIFASSWTWASAPTDSLRVYYEGNFWAYAGERLIPWLVMSAVLWLAFLLVDRLRRKRTARQNG